MNTVLQRLAFFLVSISILSACVDEPPRRPSSNAPNTQISGDTTPTPQEQPTPGANWFSQGITTKKLQINANSPLNIYLRGEGIESFLNQGDNAQKKFCLEVSFSHSQAQKLHVRAIPIVITNFSTGKTQRLFRFNFTDQQQNQNSCGDPLGNAIFNALNICPTCVALVKSANIHLYPSDGNNIDKQAFPESQQFTLGGVLTTLSLSVDPNNNVMTPENQCSDTNCQQLGFDCCVDGQCIKDGVPRPTALELTPSDTPDYQEFKNAEDKMMSDPKAYLDYPKYYYICPKQVDPGQVSEPVEDPQNVADAFLQALLDDYRCLAELDVITSSAEPFHSSFQILNSSLAEPNLNDYEELEYQDHKCNYDDESSNPLHYRNVLTRLYDNCGCDKDSELFTLNERIDSCPPYTYSLVTNDQGQIGEVVCNTPPNPNNPINFMPFQDVNTILESRSVPHSFFGANGDPIYKRSELYQEWQENNPNHIRQEGIAFGYLYEEKMLPTGESTRNYNINEVLGTISAKLDQALPALVIDIEPFLPYLIRVTDGFYTPCPTCNKDSWFEAFSAFNSTTKGWGLIGIGTSTDRRSWQNNFAQANYEDTIFGRACWLPPTMIPWSHAATGTVQEQRQQRLRTQAALFTNGYQRDWFGFNRGAVIASFDGVHWFAVGTRRKVIAESNKLFLAINAPFGDLAGNDTHSISVQLADQSTGTQTDFNPNIIMESSIQNKGGSCQQYHQCNTDSECITRLGWEYMCADISNLHLKDPVYDPNAQELLDDKEIKLSQYLNGYVTSQQNGNRRCVYRGAGAPCYSNLSHISSEQMRKNMACAPNFHCAHLNREAFSDRVARIPAALEDLYQAPNQFFGQDANVLGRPFHYRDNKALPGAVQNNIIANVRTNSVFRGNYTNLFSNFEQNLVGLCRPGKDIFASDNPREQMAAQPNPTSDINASTDTISQIAPCDAETATAGKFRSCPVLGEDGNYIYTTSNDLTDYTTKARMQNACGYEARRPAAGNHFDMLEKPLDDPLQQPGLLENACYRRAGSICQTNLDCLPNELHAEVGGLYDENDFGNLPEKRYWEEYLVCSQAAPNPDPFYQTEIYQEYDMSQNRCCRELGKTLTIYSSDTPDQSETNDLRTRTYNYESNNDGAYSRLAIATGKTELSGSRGAAAPETLNPPMLALNQWKVVDEVASKSCCGGGWVRLFDDGTNDWSTSSQKLNIDPTNFKCLNYITPLPIEEPPQMSFLDSDGDPVLDRLYIPEIVYSNEINNFCLGYKTPWGCGQISINETLSNANSVPPTREPITPTASASVLSWHEFSNYEDKMENYRVGGENENYHFALYSPFPASDDDTITTSSDPGAGDEALSPWVLAFTLPSYIPRPPDQDEFEDAGIVIRLVDDESDHLHYGSADGGLKCQPSTRYRSVGTTATATRYCFNPSNPLDHSTTGDYDSFYRVAKEADTDYTFSASAQSEPHTLSYVVDADDVAEDAGDDPPAKCTFCYEPESGVIAVAHNIENNTMAAKVTFPQNKIYEFYGYGPEGQFTYPGNMYYYVHKLAKFEYLGVPQMAYEPLYCNHDYQKVVPGLFTSDIETVNNVNSSAYRLLTDNEEIMGGPDAKLDQGSRRHPVNDPADEMRLLDSRAVDHPRIFSPHEFKCCHELGSSVASPELCCSGFGEQNNDGEFLCQLPIKTNLYVYFNKFISSEGTGDHVPEDMRLTEEDFDPYTGEPLQTTRVRSRIRLLGEQHCVSQSTLPGYLVGEFLGGPSSEPFGSTDDEVLFYLDSNSERLPSIIDSDKDFPENDRGGFFDFKNGFRWNHHIYCAD